MAFIPVTKGTQTDVSGLGTVKFRAIVLVRPVPAPVELKLRLAELKISYEYRHICNLVWFGAAVAGR